jgi:hypothetical protein
MEKEQQYQNIIRKLGEALVHTTELACDATQQLTRVNSGLVSLSADDGVNAQVHENLRKELEALKEANMRLAVQRDEANARATDTANRLNTDRQKLADARAKLDNQQRTIAELQAQISDAKLVDGDFRAGPPTPRAETGENPGLVSPSANTEKLSDALKEARRQLEFQVSETHRFANAASRMVMAGHALLDAVNEHMPMLKDDIPPTLARALADLVAALNVDLGLVDGKPSYIEITNLPPADEPKSDE